MSSSRAPKSTARKLIEWGLKLAFVAALFYFLAQKGLISLEATARAFSDWRIIPAYILLFIATSIAFVRWHWLLKAQDIQLPFSRVLELGFVGLFFNIALPGAVSGDVVKAYYIGHEVPGQRARAFGSILFDRISGLSALLVVSAIALLLDLDVLWGSKLLDALKVFLLIAASGVVAGYGFLFFVNEENDPLLRLLRRLESRIKVAGSVLRIYLGVRHYHAHRGTVARALLASIVIQTMVATACVLLLSCLDDAPFERLPVYFVVPLGLLVTAIPVLPAGVGTGHAAFGSLFVFLGTQRGADVFSLYAISQFIMGGLGGIAYLRFKRREPLAEELKAL